MSMPPISSTIHADVQNSCNWRCCICGYKRKRAHTDDQTQTEIQKTISVLAFERLKKIGEDAEAMRKMSSES